MWGAEAEWGGDYTPEIINEAYQALCDHVGYPVVTGNIHIVMEEYDTAVLDSIIRGVYAQHGINEVI